MIRSEKLRCSRCGGVLPAEDFAWRRKAIGQRDTYCRPCRSAYKREHYLANKQRYLANAAVNQRRTRLKRTEYLVAFFAAHPCADCGEADPVVLEFDHVRGVKEFNIGTKLPFRTWPTILAEIEKCDVVCANCHRRRTARRQGSVRYRLTSPDVLEAGDGN